LVSDLVDHLQLALFICGWDTVLWNLFGNFGNESKQLL
jgi:hypothetical protein